MNRGDSSKHTLLELTCLVYINRPQEQRFIIFYHKASFYQPCSLFSRLFDHFLTIANMLSGPFVLLIWTYLLFSVISSPIEPQDDLLKRESSCAAGGGTCPGK
jgi:hypothetical protein